ncbi:MAG: Fe-S cluster assembly protein IscX [Candidatus Promineifilaceae bacterium]
MDDDDAVAPLYWDSTYALALALKANYPDRSPNEVGLLELAELIEALPGFADERELGNERILMDIQIAWYEELNDS